MSRFVSDNDQPIVHHYAGGATIALYPGVEVEADVLASESLRNVSGVREVVEEEPKRSFSPAEPVEVEKPSERPKAPEVKRARKE